MWKRKYFRVHFIYQNFTSHNKIKLFFFLRKSSILTRPTNVNVNEFCRKKITLQQTHFLKKKMMKKSTEQLFAFLFAKEIWLRAGIIFLFYFQTKIISNKNYKNFYFIYLFLFDIFVFASHIQSTTQNIQQLLVHANYILTHFSPYWRYHGNSAQTKWLRSVHYKRFETHTVDSFRLARIEMPHSKVKENQCMIFKKNFHVKNDVV